jgi:hypothetical protein
MPAHTSQRLWASLALAATATASGAQPYLLQLVPLVPTGAQVWQAQGEGEGLEESESGAIDTADYLAALDIVLGHLTVGTALYAAGHGDHALTHMKHPGDEIYTDLVPIFAARGVAGFEAELATLVQAVETGAPIEKVQSALASLQAAVDLSRGTASAREQLDGLTDLIRTAADEYGIGVVDGALANLHEYQDAWGFLQIARARLEMLATDADPALATAATAALSALTATEANFPDILASGPLGHADVIYGAAARVELAALTLQ